MYMRWVSSFHITVVRLAASWLIRPDLRQSLMLGPARHMFQCMRPCWISEFSKAHHLENFYNVMCLEVFFISEAWKKKKCFYNVVMSVL